MPPWNTNVEEARRNLLRIAKSLVKLLRPQFLVAGLFLNLLGAAVAAHLGSDISLTKLLTFQLVISSCQLAGAVANEYADTATDAINKNRTWFSGGSGEFALGRISRRVVIALGVFWTISAVAGMSILSFLLGGGVGLFALMIGGLVLALGYSISPLRFSYRGVGELTMGAMVSFLGPTASFLAQHGSWDNSILAVTTPLVFQMMALMMVVEYPDFEADSVAGKRNLVVRLGRDRAWAFGIAMLLLGAASALIGMALGLPSIAAVAMALILLLETAFFWGIQGIVRRKPSFFWSTAGVSGFYVLAIGATAVLLAGIGI
jgi:1,4-dihydroxy-2-naphthoate octaprenyltransferase